MIYEKLASYYDMFVDEDLITEYLKLIKYYKKEGTVLDLGTGTGTLAIELAKENYYVTATDVSSNMLEVAYNNAIIDDVKINFFIHDILDTVNIDYDIITMSTDVINYLLDEDKVQKAFSNVSLAMNSDSIFIFDALKPSYINKLASHHEEILLVDELMIWDTTLTNIENQIKHTVKFGTHIETHLQQAYPSKEIQKLLKLANLEIIKKTKTEERIVYVCRKGL